jgi:uncharacterized 2Fe-2S/4Fe-4S cluster protein (DUF4445 family)
LIQRENWKGNKAMKKEISKEGVVVFFPDGLRTPNIIGESLMSISTNIKLGIEALCGGKGICGKCRARITTGSSFLSPPTLWEKKHLSVGELNANWRLVCQSIVEKPGKIEVDIPPSSKIGVQRLQIDGADIQFPIEPLLDITKEKGTMLGLAFDIGSTKIGGWLVDLRTGEILGQGACMNPQIPYGEDIMSRIGFANQNQKNLDRLHQAILDGIRTVFTEIQEQTGTKAHDIYLVSLVGNTAMHHFSLGYPVESLSFSPFSPFKSQAVEKTTDIIGLNLAPNAQVHFPPVIAGFIGSDPLMGVLSTQMHKSNDFQLLIDVGTNTEVVVGNNQSLSAVSCASGPAFEGAHILHGMRATSGAIERVKIDPKSLSIDLKTIDNQPPRGICGSGIVDVIAEFFLAGIIDNRGAFSEKAKSRSEYKKDSGIAEYTIAPKERAGVPNDITITQKDIREIQLAKSAIYTGISVLLRNYHRPPTDLKRIFVAGAFGSYIDPLQAQIIGLFPEVELSKFEIIGNSAGTGARMVLLSKTKRSEAIDLAKQIQYIELSESPWFKEEFTNSMFLPHRNTDLFPKIKKLSEKNHKL